MKLSLPAWQCEYMDCQHTWLAIDPESPPAQCAKCKRRGWNTSDSASASKSPKITKRTKRTNVTNVTEHKIQPKIVERALSIATTRARTTRTCPTCKGEAYERLFAGDFWCPKCGKRVE